MDDDTSDFEDSLLCEVARAPVPMRRPRVGERLGGEDGRRFEILKELGGGAMGLVFSARDTKLSRTVALKFLQPVEASSGQGLIKQFRQEAEAIARLGHENIVRLHDTGEWAGEPWEERVPFLWMECLEGESLASLMEREPPDVRRAVSIMRSVAAGLEHAHAHGIIHRDLKPSNVFITRDGTVKLLDFGLAALAEQGTSSIPQLPKAGTPPYMAPEQWRGEPQDERTDLWAAGVLLYELLTGALPFPSANLEELRARIVSEERIPSVREARSDLPEELDALVASLLERNPARRLHSAAELKDRLLRVEELLSPWQAPLRTPSPVRRQVTLLGCSMTGQGGLSEWLDPEDATEVQAAFHEAFSQVVKHFGGSILFLGNEVIACFGHPRAREDDSECAARAALRLPEAFKELLREKLPIADLPPLGLRVGLHTDMVVFDNLPPELQQRTPALQGEAPQLVRWVAQQAEPNTVCVSGTTATLIHGAFQTRPLGVRIFDGQLGKHGVELHQVVRERRAGSRFSRTHGPGALTPMVNRERELAQLRDIWDRLQAGQGAFVLLTGEAGIGKSRLLQELRRHVPAAAAMRLQCQCWAQFSHTAYQPIIETFQHLLRLSPALSPECNLSRLRKQLGGVGMGAEQVGLIASLLALPVDESLMSLRLSPQRKKEKTFEAVVELLRRLAARRPVLITIEDLHWADPSTVELLGYLLEHLGPARVAVVLSARPDFQPGWPRQDALLTVELDRLSAALTARLAREAADGHALSAAQVRQLVEKTDGIPLFVEEMTRMVLARPSGEGTAQGPRRPAIPVTLNELLLARLDMLPPRQKVLAQQCAVVGRSFSRELLEALAGSHDGALRQELAGLREAGLLVPCEDTPEPGYQFRHALLQEAAYQSLPRGTRRRYHGRTAQVLETRFPQVAASQPEVLAHHYTEAGRAEPAIRYWALAGELASRRSANVEAVSHLGQALTLLRGLPDAPKRKEDELKLLLALGMPLVQLEGGSFRVEQTYARAWELILELGDALPRLDLSYWGIFSYYFVRADFQRAHQLASHLVRLAEQQGQPELLALGLRMEAVDLFTFGQMPEARERVERALECSDFSLERHRAIAVKQWLDPRAVALSYGSVVCSVTDELETARRYGQEALRLAEDIGHPNTTAFVLTYTALAAQLRREPTKALEGATRGIAVAREHQFLFWLGWCSIIRAWAVAELGQPREGLEQLKVALAKWRGSGLRTGMPLFLGMVAELQLQLGDPQKARVCVLEGLGWAEEKGERSYESELHRLQGESLWALGETQEAARHFMKALQVARGQGARAFERHALESLASHHQELRLQEDTLGDFEEEPSHAGEPGPHHHGP